MLPDAPEPEIVKSVVTERLVPVAAPITGVVKVNPAIVVTVAPELITVEPIVGAEYPATVPQDDVVPSVVRYLPELPD